MEEGVAVGDGIFFVVHGPMDSVLLYCGHSSGQTLAVLSLHQLVHLGVVGGADTEKDRNVRVHLETQPEMESDVLKTVNLIHNPLVNANNEVPGIKSTEQEDNQSHNALSVPPLDSWGRGWRDWSWWGSRTA